MRDEQPNEQLKIELLSQWKLEAESRNSTELLDSGPRWKGIGEANLNRGVCGSIKSILISLCGAEGLIKVLPDPRSVQHCSHAVVLKGTLVSPSGKEAFGSNSNERFGQFPTERSGQFPLLADSKLKEFLASG